MPIDPEILKSEHAEYRGHKEEWAFAQETWDGKSAYVHKHLNRLNKRESAGRYERRKNESHFDNLARSIGQIYLNTLWGSAESPTRNIEQRPLNEIVEKADRAGRPLSAFMREVSKWTLIYGWCGVIVMKTNGAETGQPDSRPYWTIVQPLSIVNWDVDENDKLIWIRIKETATSQSAFDAQETTTTQYLTLFRDGWLKHDEEGEQVGGGEYQVLVDGEPVVPISFFYFNQMHGSILGTSWFYDVARANKTLFNLESRLESAISRYLFPLLARNIDSAIPQPVRDRDVEEIINTFDYSGEQLPQFLNLPVDGWEHAKTQLDRTERKMYRAAGLESRTRSPDLQQSAESKSLDRSQAEEMIKLWGQNIEASERHAFTLSAAWNQQEFDGEIEYPESYTIPQFEADLGRFREIRDLYEDLSTTVVQKEAVKTYSRLQARDVSQEDLAEIEAEIEASLSRQSLESNFNTEIEES